LGSKALTLHCNGKKILGIVARLPMRHANSNTFVVSVKPGLPLRKTRFCQLANFEL
jgi:hypothetical protein